MQAYSPVVLYALLSFMGNHVTCRGKQDDEIDKKKMGIVSLQLCILKKIYQFDELIEIELERYFIFCHLDDRISSSNPRVSPFFGKVNHSYFLTLRKKPEVVPPEVIPLHINISCVNGSEVSIASYLSLSNKLQIYLICNVSSTGILIGKAA